MNVAWRGEAPECSLARSAANRSRTRRRPRPRSTFPLPRFYVRDSDVVERAIMATAADTNRGRDDDEYEDDSARLGRSGASSHQATFTQSLRD
jgi:hypothetical protein